MFWRDKRVSLNKKEEFREFLPQHDENGGGALHGEGDIGKKPLWWGTLRWGFGPFGAFRLQR